MKAAGCSEGSCEGSCEGSEEGTSPEGSFTSEEGSPSDDAALPQPHEAASAMAARGNMNLSLLILRRTLPFRMRIYRNPDEDSPTGGSARAFRCRNHIRRKSHIYV